MTIGADAIVQVLGILLVAGLGAVAWYAKRIVARFDANNARLDRVEGEVAAVREENAATAADLRADTSEALARLREAQAATIGELRALRLQQQHQHEQNVALLRGKR